MLMSCWALLIMQSLVISSSLQLHAATQYTFSFAAAVTCHLATFHRSKVSHAADGIQVMVPSHGKIQAEWYKQVRAFKSSAAASNASCHSTSRGGCSGFKRRGRRLAGLEGTVVRL
jgi:hypothetical protein